jgi:hypothetical protein
MYNNKDLTSMGLTHTRLRLALVHVKLVTSTKRTLEPLQSALYHVPDEFWWKGASRGDQPT